MAKKELTDVDREVRAIRRIVAALDGLSGSQKLKVLNFVTPSVVMPPVAGMLARRPSDMGQDAMAKRLED